MVNPRHLFSVKILSLAATAFMLLLFGAFMYHTFEGWSFVDSLYFSAVTLTTVGYGDLYPTTDAAKLFTVFFVFIGVGTMLYILSLLAGHYMETHQPQMEVRVKKALDTLNIKKNVPDRWIMIKANQKK